MAVLPNSMPELDPRDIPGSFRAIEDYIEYMREQLEYALRPKEPDPKEVQK